MLLGSVAEPSLIVGSHLLRRVVPLANGAPDLCVPDAPTADDPDRLTHTVPDARETVVRTG
ncbi:hypothetical protein GCM10023320_38810 [Pseudonocardia adelaidensis]|uniref:Uncharacterized protein n=1 Tax=Pseudonocardia adelaidensis TaxID=648754 RepID=A0ABP9NMB4_9PSEU